MEPFNPFDTVPNSISAGYAKGLCGDELNFANPPNKLGAIHMDVVKDHKGEAPAPHESAMK